MQDPRTVASSCTTPFGFRKTRPYRESKNGNEKGRRTVSAGESSTCDTGERSTLTSWHMSTGCRVGKYCTACTVASRRRQRHAPPMTVATLLSVARCRQIVKTALKNAACAPGFDCVPFPPLQPSPPPLPPRLCSPLPIAPMVGALTFVRPLHKRLGFSLAAVAPAGVSVTRHWHYAQDPLPLFLRSAACVDWHFP